MIWHHATSARGAPPANGCPREALPDKSAGAATGIRPKTLIFYQYRITICWSALEQMSDAHALHTSTSVAVLRKPGVSPREGTENTPGSREMPNTVYVATPAVRYYISYCDGPQDGLLDIYTGSFNWKYGAVRNAGKPSHRITVHDAQAKLSFGSFKKSWRC